MPPATRRRSRPWWSVLAIVGLALAAAATNPGILSMRSSSETLPSDSDAAVVQRFADRSGSAQPAGLIYGSSSGASAYAHPGGLVVAGRNNYQDQPFKDVSASGGTVLIYLDPIIDESEGRYHALLISSSTCGPATARWPGDYRASEHGYLTDFRVGSVLQQKLECVLETMVRENPHMAGWFADDLGSRSWFPDIDWAAFPDKRAYREGAIALSRTFRTVADKYGLIFLVNGTWSADDGGGYPERGAHGNALADGGVVEHHDGEIGFFGPYGCSDQWAAQSPVTDGNAVNYVITETSAGTAEYLDSKCYAYVGQQSDYGSVEPWGQFHPGHLPSQVTQPE